MEKIYGEMVIQYKNTDAHFPVCVCKRAQHKKKKYICMQQKIDYQKPWMGSEFYFYVTFKYFQKNGFKWLELWFVLEICGKIFFL